jgi:hypothetical protein
MTQRRLDRAVARATGETLSTIRRRGFSVFDPTGRHEELDELPRPQTVNWDQLDADRAGYVPQRARSQPNHA